MTKAEMEKLLIEEYGYDKKDLKDSKGNRLNNSELEKMIESEKSKKEADTKETELTEDERESDIFRVDETVFESNHNLDDKDLVLCMAGVNGDMNFSSPISNFRQSTKAFGQTIKIPYGDLSYVHNIAPDAFEKGKIIVLNESVQAEFGLGDLYKRVITPKNVRSVINLDAEELKQFIKEMPQALKVSLYDEARKMYKQGEIDSMKTVKVLEEEYGVSFEDNAPSGDTINK